MFDRFDICEAWYLALSHCHNGRDTYERLCSMSQAPLFFKPSPLLEVKSLNENSKRIYRAACHKLLSKTH